MYVYFFFCTWSSESCCFKCYTVQNSYEGQYRFLRVKSWLAFSGTVKEFHEERRRIWMFRPNRKISLDHILPVSQFSAVRLTFFCTPWRTHSEDSGLRTTTTSWSTACLKNSDTSAKFYTSGIQRLTQRCKKDVCVLVMKGTLWKNESQLRKLCTYDICKFHVIVVLVPEKRIGGISCTNQRMHSLEYQMKAFVGCCVDVILNILFFTARSC